LRDEQGIREEDDDLLVLGIGGEIGGERSDWTVCVWMPDDAIDPREGDRDLRRVYGTSDDRGPIAVEKGAMPVGDPTISRVHEELVLPSEPRRLPR
jgi:hypothetical protein